MGKNPWRIPILHIPWDGLPKQKQEAVKPQAPKSGTELVRERFALALEGLRTGTCSLESVSVADDTTSPGVKDRNSTIRVVALSIGFLHCDDQNYLYLQKVLFDTMRHAMKNPHSEQGVALRAALAQAGIHIFRLKTIKERSGVCHCRTEESLLM